MVWRSTVEVKGLDGSSTRTIFADAVGDVPAADARFGDQLLDQLGQAFDLVETAGVHSWAIRSGPGAGATSTQEFSTAAENPAIAPGVGRANSLSGLFNAPAGTLYGLAFVTDTQVLLPPPWPIPYGPVNLGFLSVLQPTDQQVRVNWLDSPGAGVAANVIKAVVRIVWFVS